MKAPKVKKLILLRHAHAPYLSEVDDHNRPLSKQGISQSMIMATVLSEITIATVSIFHSTAMRTSQTAQLVTERIKILGELNPIPRLYNASKTTIWQLISSQVGVTTLIIVGHNPGISELAKYLHGNENVNLDPACAAAFTYIGFEWDQISSGCYDTYNFYQPTSDKELHLGN